MRRATFTGAGQALKIIDDVIPEAPPEGALIRTSYSGVCHSDVHLRKDEVDFGNGHVFRALQVHGGKYLGTTFGHEISGVIIAFGDKADPKTQDLNIGDEVIVYPWIGCQKCEVCMAGSNNICEKNNHGAMDIGMNPEVTGGFATHVPVPACRFLIKVPDHMPLAVACMLPCSGATAYSSLLKVTPQIHKVLRSCGMANLLIIGAGGLGLWCIQLAKKALFPDIKLKIFVADITEDKIKVALEAGADEGLLWDRDGTVQDIVWKSTKNGEKKMDAVINFVGSAKTTDIGMWCLHKGGLLVVIGLAGGSLQISLPILVLSGITICGGKTSSLSELGDLVDIVAKSGLQYPSLQYMALEKVNDAIDDLEAGKVRGRVIIKFN